MSIMTGNSNRSYLNMIFAFGDGFLIIGGVMLGNIFRFGSMSTEIIYAEYLVAKIIAILLIIQIVFYYFDLYEFKSVRDKTRVTILILEALGISSILLALIYYFIPSLSVGRGVFILSLIGIFSFTLVWRLVYPWIVDKRVFKERVLIIGTGEFAEKIKKEIYENGQGAFEIAGFVDEDRERIGEGIRPDDHWGLQPDLFHLQNR
jgi:FlaA1/EpsC-like NDP-sugar epimerase